MQSWVVKYTLNDIEAVVCNCGSTSTADGAARVADSVGSVVTAFAGSVCAVAAANAGSEWGHCLL